MEYILHNKTCNYNSLGKYQTAKCGKGIVAPVFVSTPFLTDFKSNSNNSNNNQNVLTFAMKGTGQLYNDSSNCCDTYNYLNKSYDTYYPYKSFEFSNLMNIQRNKK